MSKGPSLKIKDFTKAFNDSIAALTDRETLVGIPQEDTGRTTQEISDAGEPINNAALLFINEFGSDLQNIPPRPVMAIGIRAVQDQIAEEWKKCVKASFSKGGGVFDKYYQRVGMIASNSIKQTINAQTDIDGPAESTLANRRSKGFKGNKALIVTGQMRNAITYVVRNKKWGK